ncbi:hypothetical protein WA026_017824 [Henosepilachna vigintioctopunctata]|uniref:CHK kinase-like domain-containing protein n=1 Tax=Henosepilachna vigintioctopunctata TaxID=420089 RepID=A0AAW1TLT0_9CUCU
MSEELKKTIISWVKEVLSDQGFTEIQVDFPEYDPSGGYGSEMVMVNVTGERNKSKEVLSLIVKRSIDDILDTNSLNFRVFYDNETNFYSKIVPYLRQFAMDKGSKPFDSIPYCYGTIQRENRHVIVMENLKKKGYKVHEIENPQDLHHTKLILKAYGEWHALCFALRDQQPKKFEEFSNTNSSEKVLEAKGFSYMITTIEKELQFLMDIYKTRGITLVADKLELLKNNFGTMIHDFMLGKNESYLVIRHGDCWNNNYLFHYDDDTSHPDKVAIIDWQVACVAPAMLDIVHFLYYCCSRNELDNLDELLHFYHDCLSEKLKELGSDPEKCFPRDICLSNFKKYAPFGIAGLPMVGKIRSKLEIAEAYNIANVERDKSFNSIFDGKLKDPEEYFKNINDVLEFSIDRKFI